MDNTSKCIPYQKPIKSLSIKLNIEFQEAMQGWEYEITDANRVLEFIEKYHKACFN